MKNVFIDFLWGRGEQSKIRDRESSWTFLKFNNFSVDNNLNNISTRFYWKTKSITAVSLGSDLYNLLTLLFTSEIGNRFIFCCILM